MEAMRVTVSPSCGILVTGTWIQIPGSTWIPTLSPWIVISLMVCRWGTSLRKASGCAALPRFGTEPKLGENERLSEVRFNSKMLSRGGGGGGTGFGSDVGVAVLSGRKMVLKPFPTQSPTNAESGPSGGGGVGGTGLV